MLYSCFFKRSHNHLRGFLIAAWGRVPKLQSIGIYGGMPFLF